MYVKELGVKASNSFKQNLSNCWELPSGQSAAKPYMRNVQRLSKA